MKSAILAVVVLLIIQLKANRLLQQTDPAVDPCATIRCSAGYTCCKDGSGGATCCKDAVVCPADVEQCCDGTYVSRDPDNNCQFPECSNCLDPKDTCLPRVNCLINPCDADLNNRGDCGENEECTANYCGGCNAVCTECGASECLDPSGQCASEVVCAKDPCDPAISPCQRGQTCAANYCGGCNAVCTDPVFCTKDAKVCPDGTVVGRDHNNGCQFFPCPGDSCGKQGVNCGGIKAPAFTCSDGTCYGNCGTCSYQADSNGNLVCSPEMIAKEDVCPCKGLENCASYTPDGCNTCGCPEDGSLSFCTLSMCPPELITTKPQCKTCRDGYDLDNGVCVKSTCCDPEMGKFSNNPVCREGCACCPDGTWSGSIGDGKTFTCSGQTCIGQEACGGTVCEPVGCPEDAKVCPDGTVLSRDPTNNCEFPECPICQVVQCLVPPCPCLPCSGSNACLNAAGQCDVIANCLVDPCQFNNGGCKSDQNCESNYCGGCNAICTDKQPTLPPGCATILCPVGSSCCDDGSGGAACCSDPLPRCCDMEDFPELCFEGVQCCPNGKWSCSIGDGKTYPCSGESLVVGQDTFGDVCPVQPNGDKIECKGSNECDKDDGYRCKTDKGCRKRWAAKGKCKRNKVCLREGGSCKSDTDCYKGYSCVGKKRGTGICVDYQEEE